MDKHEINVFTYNILTSSYCNPKTYPNVQPEFLEEKKRWKNISDMLTAQFKKNSIILLQEIPEKWRGKIEILSCKFSYKPFVRNYSHYYSGFMGVGILVPKCYDILRISYFRPCCLAKEICMPPKIIEDESNDNEDSEFSINPFTYISHLFNIFNYDHSPPLVECKKKETHEILSKRSNVQIMMILKNKEDIKKRRFAICTYHAPLILNDELTQYGSSICSIKTLFNFIDDLPVIFGGDFNFLPKSRSYNVFVGKSEIDAEYNPEYEPLKSAFVEIFGKEPKYTTKSEIKSNSWSPINSFEGTLDYIFYRNLKIKKCGIIFGGEYNTFMPNKYSPSDHLPLFATFNHE
jgi:mRNA deadenylase 3'-5' endonuclease subunit Ccr4